MWQTLFTIPRQIAGHDLFGFGVLFWIWLALSIVLLSWSMRRYGWSPETRGHLSMLAVFGVAIVFVLPWIIQPEGLAIRGWGVMLLVSMLGASAITLYRGAQRGLDQEMLLSMGTWLFSSGIIGARVFYIIEYWDQFQKPTLGATVAAVLNLTQGGMVVYGSLLAGGLAMIAFVYKHHLPALAMADLLAPAVVLGVGLGRIGCFLNGCCHGGISDVPWAVQFPPTSPAYMDQMEHGQLYIHGLVFKGSQLDPPVIAKVEPGSPAEHAGLKPGERIVAIGPTQIGTVAEAQAELLMTYGAGKRVDVTIEGDPAAKSWVLQPLPALSRPVHPTQLYSFFDAMFLLFLVLAYEPYKRRDGELAALVLTVHPISRFLLEVIRVDEGAILNTGMSIAQNISLAIFAVGIALWIYLLWRRPVGCAWPPRLAVAA